MKRIVLIIMLLVPIFAQAGERVLAVIGAEVWASPRTGAALANYAPLRGLMQQWLATPEGRLQVRYPEDEWGEVWGQELEAWLVALGVSSDHIELQAGYEGGDAVALVLITPDDESEPASTTEIPEEESPAEDEAISPPAAESVDQGVSRSPNEE